MKHKQGFSLIELMVVVIVIGILTAIAYPNYVDQMNKTRRSDAQIALMDTAARMERFFTENNSYSGATLAGINVNATTPEGHYTISISSLTPTSFTLSAAPVAGGAQANDACGTLTLTNTNIKGPTPDTCW